MQTGDFNNDGRDDILWENDGNNGTENPSPAKGQGMIWIMNESRMAPASNAIVYKLKDTEPASKWTVIKLLDFNGNGKADILWENAGTKK